MKRHPKAKYENSAYLTIRCSYCYTVGMATIQKATLDENKPARVQCQACGKVNIMIMTTFTFSQWYPLTKKAARNG